MTRRSTIWCPDCGMPNKTMGSHRGSTPCKAGQARRAAFARGLVPVRDGAEAPTLWDLGVQIESLPTSYERHPARLVYRPWAPEMAVVLVRQQWPANVRGYPQILADANAQSMFLLGGTDALWDYLMRDTGHFLEGGP